MNAANAQIQERLVAASRKLLESDEVEMVIGFGASSVVGRARPVFARDAEASEAFIFDASCTANLTVYLPRIFRSRALETEETGERKKIGIVVKGCDARTLAGLIQQKQVPRDAIHILGIPCTGVVDHHKVERLLSGADLAAIEHDPEIDGDAPGGFQLTDYRGNVQSVSSEGVLRDVCLSCRHPTPVIYDELLADPVEPRQDDRRLAKLEDLESQSVDERWDHFVSEVSKCIRCNACRQACPNCYCAVCFSDQTDPAWTSPSSELSELVMFHVGRLMHNVGRCTQCGACSAACPKGVDLTPYMEMLARETELLFSAEAGLDMESLPALSDFRMEDDQSFITEPR